MGEKLIAGVVAATVIAPLCTVCILGPAVIASVLAGLAGWFGAFDTGVTVAIVLAAGIAAVAIFRRQRAQRTLTIVAGEKY